MDTAHTLPPAIHGLLAEFDTPRQLVDAAKRAYAAGYRRMDTFSPFPIEEAWEAIGHHDRRLSLIVLCGGIAGLLTGFSLEEWVHNIAYPANIAGTQNDLSNYARPNLVGDPIPAHQTAAQWYNPKAFSIPSGSYGNFGRNVLRASHVVNLDFSVFKNIRVAEHHQLQLRVEALNLLNIQNYGVPGTTIGNASAGIISSVSVPARQLQLALKYAF